jgi:hypothetical protein
LLVFGGPFKNGFDIIWQISDSRFAFAFHDEQDDDSDNLNDQFDDTDDDGEHTDFDLSVVVGVPDGGPVYDPDDIGDDGESHEVPHSRFLLRLAVIP